MNQKNTQKTKLIANILNQEGVVFAYLFGSQVNGKTGALSDFDVAVYFGKPQCRNLPVQLRLTNALEKGLGLKTDVLFLNDAPPVLSQQIISSGKLIVDTDKKVRLDFETRILQSFEDTAYFRSVFYQAMEERIKKRRIGVFKHG